ncbi:MAG: hypothetical protein P3W87_005185 [Gammaproteobacteria bacterium]|nr:hypothetical protein [Gammaproteobacteria bacterium]
MPDNLSSGADDDIRQATQLARAMLGRWGMSRKIGPVDLRESNEQPFLGLEIAQPRRYSEHAARAVDEAVQALQKAQGDRARGHPRLPGRAGPASRGSRGERNAGAGKDRRDPGSKA